MQTMILSIANLFQRRKLRAAFTVIAAFIGVLSACLTGSAWAGYDFNIPQPATPISQQIYGLHMYILIVCAVIFVVVFSMMFYSIFKFRKSKGAKPDVNFHESTLIEIIWTIIPFIILIAMAIPATKTILAMKDTRSRHDGQSHWPSVDMGV